MFSLTRRRFLGQSSAAALAAAGFSRGGGAAEGPPAVSFFVVGDTHFLADEAEPSRLFEASAGVTARLVDTLNRLPGSAIPESAGGGLVPVPQGVLHAGDLVDSGDKNGAKYEAMQRCEWSGYTAAFGLSGTEGRLHFPVMEVAGNHDAPGGRGYIIEQLAARQRSRKNLKAISGNGLHYSWEWGGVHFVALGLIVGTEKSCDRARRYAALDSLDFLREDLAAHAAPEQALVVLHHVDVARYTAEKAGVDYTHWEWDPADVKSFYAALRGRRAATFHGHTHARRVMRWNGDSVEGSEGIPVFNVDNGSHYGSPAQAFFQVEIRAGELLVREYATADGWQSGNWTPQVWRAAL